MSVSSDVSIVVPVFNGEAWVRESLDSILNQTDPAREIIVMDDASTDSTPDILSSYQDSITVHRQPENRGQFENVNDGIRHARGEYIAIYHADDIYAADIVREEVEFLESHPAAGGVFALDVFIDKGGHEYGRLSLPRLRPSASST